MTRPGIDSDQSQSTPINETRPAATSRPLATTAPVTSTITNPSTSTTPNTSGNVSSQIRQASGGIPSHSNPASGSNASGMSTNISIKELGKEIAEAITSSNSKGAVPMPKFGNRDNEEIGIFLRKYEQFGTAQNWSHDDLLQRLPLSLVHGASAWYARQSQLPNEWIDMKTRMLAEFRPPTMLEYRTTNLRRRVMKPDESVTQYYEDVMELYDILESLGKVFSPQEKADKLTAGLHGAVFRDVTMMGPTNPQEFLMKAGKAIDMERKAERRPRVMKDAREPVSLTDIYRTEPLPRMTPSGGNGNYRGNNFNPNYYALKQGSGRERTGRSDGYQSYNGGNYNGIDRFGNRPFGRQNFNQIGGSRNYANNNSRGNQLGNYPQNRENRNNYQNSNYRQPWYGNNAQRGGEIRNRNFMSPPAGGGNSNNAVNNRPPIACYNCGGPHFKSQCKEPTTGGPQARQQVNFLQQGMGDLSLNIIEIGVDHEYQKAVTLLIGGVVPITAVLGSKDRSTIGIAHIKALGLWEGVDVSTQWELSIPDEPTYKVAGRILLHVKIFEEMWVVETDVTDLEVPQNEMLLGKYDFMEMMQGRYMKRRIQQKPLDWIDYMHIAGDHTQNKNDDNVLQPLTLFNKACGQVSSNEPDQDNISTEGNYDDFEDISLDDLNTYLGASDPQETKTVVDNGTQTGSNRRPDRRHCYMCKSKTHVHSKCPEKIVRDKRLAEIFDLLVINDHEIRPDPTSEIDPEDKAIMPMKIEGHNALTLWDTGASCSLVAEDIIQQLGLMDKVSRSTKVALTCASGFKIHAEGTIDLEIEACGLITVIKAHVLKCMPNEYDMIFGWPDTRKLLAEKNTKQKRQQNENADAVDYSCLEKPIKHILQKEVLYVNTDNTFFAQTPRQIVGRCGCGHQSVSDYQSIKHGEACMIAIRQALGIPKFLCSCGKSFICKPVWVQHQKDYHRNTSDFICPVSNCYHIAKDFEIAIEHHRAHGTWKERETPEVGEVLLFSTTGNAKALEGALMSKNPLLKIDELSYGKHLEPDQLQAVKKLILKHENLFGTEEIPIGQAKVKPIEFVVMPDSKPVWQPVRRISPKEREFVQKEIDQMLKDGRLEPSRSPWQSPIHLAPKGPDNKRLVGDYRKLNEVLVEPKYPIPLISDILDQLKGSRYFTTLDMTSGFQQLPVAEKSRDYLSIITTAGTFRPTTMPYGINSCAGLFQQTMIECFSDMLGKDLISVYIDDLCIGHENLHDHLRAIDKVLTRLGEKNFTLNLKKCKWAVPTVKLLGFVLSEQGIGQDPEKTRAIKEYPVPKTITDVRSFIGLASFYRMFIPKFSEISKPLTQLYSGSDVKKTARIQWLDVHQTAFETLKERLTTFPCLAYFQDDLETFVHCDASKEACGAVLAQKHGKYLKPCAFASRRFSSSESNLSTVEKEALCIVWISVKWRSYLIHREVTIVTDQKSLTWLFSLKTPNEKLQRWSLLLSQFRFKIEHKAGILNRDADALSRYAVGEPELPEDQVIMPVLHMDRVDLRKDQLHDKFCKEIMAFLEGEASNASDRIKRLSSGFYMDDGILYYRIKEEGWNRELLVLPKSHWLDICLSIHDNKTGLAHLGYKKCLDALSQRFYFKNMAKILRQYISSCVVCQTRNPMATTKLGNLQNIPIPSRPFSVIVCDTVGPLKRSSGGYKYILTAVCELSSYVIARPVRSHSSLEFAKFLLYDVILRYGFMKVLRSDRGTEMEGTVKELLKLLEIKHLKSSGWRPQTTGKIETQHRALGQILSKLCSESNSDWHLAVPYACFAMNASKHSITGISPYQALYGVPCPFQFDSEYPVKEQQDPFVTDTANRLENIRAFITFNIKESKRYTETLYNESRKPVTLQVGDQCLLFSPMRKADRSKKLTHFFHGPYHVMEQSSPVNFRISYNRPGHTGGTIVNVARLKKWHSRAMLEDQLNSSSDEEQIPLEKEEKIRINTGSLEYSSSDEEKEKNSDHSRKFKSGEENILKNCARGTTSGEQTHMHASRSKGQERAAARQMARQDGKITGKTSNGKRLEMSNTESESSSSETEDVTTPTATRTDESGLPENSTEESSDEDFDLPEGRTVTPEHHLLARGRSQHNPRNLRRSRHTRDMLSPSRSPEIYPNQRAVKALPVINASVTRKKRNKSESRTTHEKLPKDRKTASTYVASDGEAPLNVRRSARERKATDKYGYSKPVNMINKLPVWMTTLLLLLCVSSTAALTARTFQCGNKKLVGSLDLSQYTRCEKLAEQPNPRNVSYEVFAMKKASNYFPATVCKATVQTLTVQKFFWGATDTVPSSQTKDLSPDECHRMVKNLDCFSNPMTKVPGTNAWAFNEKPDQTSSWLTTTKNVKINCFVESTRLLQQEKDADITGIVGSLGNRKSDGYATKAGMTFIWDTSTESTRQSCAYESISIGFGFVYNMENGLLRVRDSVRQVEFILENKTADVSCNFTAQVYHVHGGFTDVLLSLVYTSDIQPADELPELRRYRRQLQERIVDRESYLDGKSPSERAVEEARRISSLGETQDRDMIPTPIPTRATQTESTRPRRTRTTTVIFPSTETSIVSAMTTDQAENPAPKTGTTSLPAQNTSSSGTESLDFQQAEDQRRVLEEQRINNLLYEQEMRRWREEQGRLRQIEAKKDQETERMEERRRIAQENLRREDHEYQERKLEEQRSREQLRISRTNTIAPHTRAPNIQTRPASVLATMTPYVYERPPVANWVPPGAYQLIAPYKDAPLAKSPTQRGIDHIKAEYAKTNQIQMELMLSHLQYIEDHQLTISNLVSSEVHQLDCKMRKNRATLINLLAKQSGVRAAQLLGLSECSSVVSHGAMALLYQCEVLNTTVTARKTKCGMEPAIGNGTLSLDGYTITTPFVPCLHDGHFAQIGEQTYEFNKEQNDWVATTETVHLSHSHLAAVLDITADVLASEGTVNFHESQDRNVVDLIGELSAVMQTSGQTSLMDAISRSNHDMVQTSNVPDVSGVFEIFTGWRTGFITVIATIGGLVILCGLCRCCGPIRVWNFCLYEKRRRQNQRELPYTGQSTGTDHCCRRWSREECPLWSKPITCNH